MGSFVRSFVLILVEAFAFFYVLFVTIGSFFVINIFVGVVVHKFQVAKDDADGKSLFLSENQVAVRSFVIARARARSRVTSLAIARHMARIAAARARARASQTGGWSGVEWLVPQHHRQRAPPPPPPSGWGAGRGRGGAYSTHERRMWP